MKISDFLRMKITPDNKQFDTIKNIRFYDDNPRTPDVSLSKKQEAYL